MAFNSKYTGQEIENILQKANGGGVILTDGEDLSSTEYTITKQGIQKIQSVYSTGSALYIKKNSTIYICVLIEQIEAGYNLAFVNSSGSYDNISVNESTLKITINGNGSPLH